MTSPAQVSIHDFATWDPVLRLLRKANATVLDAPGGQVSGRISLSSWSAPVFAGHDAVHRVQAALTEAGMHEISFRAQISAQGHAVLSLFASPPTMEPYIGNGGYPGTVVRHAQALPEPARRLPDPNSGALHHPSVDLALLERVLRERLPGTTGASGEELAAAEARLGIPLPDELRTLYRTMRTPVYPEGDEDWEDVDERVGAPLGELFHPLDDVYIGDAATRQWSWLHLAQEAVITPPEAAVQQLVGSPGWIVFGDDHENQQYAIDMTPGPRGHLGQVISLPYDEDTRAYLVAHSLTDFVQRRYAEDSALRDESLVIARIRQGGQQGVEAIAHPDLEVLTIGMMARPWEGVPLSLAPLARLPKLRTLCAEPETLADPLEVGQLAALEYLELGLEDWRTLLDAKALPGSLLAAKVIVPLMPFRGPMPDPAAYFAVANEIISLWNGPKIAETVIGGQLS